MSVFARPVKTSWSSAREEPRMVKACAMHGVSERAIELTELDRREARASVPTDAPTFRVGGWRWWVRCGCAVEEAVPLPDIARCGFRVTSVSRPLPFGSPPLTHPPPTTNQRHCVEILTGPVCRVRAAHRCPLDVVTDTVVKVNPAALAVGEIAP